MANALPTWKSFGVEEGLRKVYMEKDTRIPNAAIFTVMREDHTLANILRSKLLTNSKVLFAGYKIAHPLEPEFTLRLQTTPDTSPLEVLQDEINKLISELREAETEFEGYCMTRLEHSTGVTLLFHEMDEIRSGPNIILGVTGSVAAIKVTEIMKLLTGDKDLRANLKVVLTENSKRFLDSTQFDKLSAEVMIYQDSDEWDDWNSVTRNVLHIDLRRWAHYVVIAPLDACTLAKIAAGICDNLLTCIVRSMDINSSTLVVCPAMNTLMWDNPFTKMHLDTLSTIYRAVIVNPVSKKLACNDVGMGALAAPITILSLLKDLYIKSS